MVVHRWVVGRSFLSLRSYFLHSRLAEEPVPPPAKGWGFWRAEPEPEPGEAERPPPLSPFSVLRAERERELTFEPEA